MTSVKKQWKKKYINLYRRTNKMKLADRQAKLDAHKWEMSQKAGHDTCGEYDFCTYCKGEEAFPCARAYDRFDRELRSTSAYRKDKKKK